MFGNFILSALLGAGATAYGLNKPFRRFANKTAKRGHELYKEYMDEANGNGQGIIKSEPKSEK